MDKIYQIVSRRRFVWPLLFLPGIWRLVIPAMTDGLGFNPLFELLHRTGRVAVWMLAAVLALTPLKTIFPRARWAAALNRHRRAVGVCAFVYAVLHVTENFLYEGEFKGYFANVWKPFFLTGTLGITVLLLLAATSNDFSVRRLGYKFWKWLHRLVYFAALALAWHMGTAGKGNWPAAKKVFIPLLALQIVRVGKPISLFAWGRVRRIWREPEWKDWRDFEIARREAESETITSFYLRPVDGRRLPRFQPGQFLTVQMIIPGQPKPVVRTYTISDASNGKTYRLTIKRESSGLVSNFFHDNIREGARVRARPPAGEFVLNSTSNGPVILVSAGVGITPMIAMLNALVAEGATRPIWFLHGTRNRREHAFRNHVEELASKHPNIRARIRYSQPGSNGLAEGADEQRGRIDADFLKRTIPGLEGDFYLCGPGAFMQSLHDVLRTWGVAPERIHYEFFGPATVKFNGNEAPKSSDSFAGQKVEFQPAGVNARWDPACRNLLELALKNGAKPAYGCKSGVCGMCSSFLVSGDVTYERPPACPIAPGSLLLCSAVPKTDLVIALPD